MKSRNLAIVFVDIVDFTRISSTQSREQGAAWLARFGRLMKSLAGRLGGRLVKSIGDAVLLVFESPTDALLFGMAAQDSVFARNLEVEEQQRMRIRVAVSVGEVRLQRGDVFGEAVNLAARLESVTPAGAIWFTESTYLAMTRSEVAAEKVGHHTFKGISEPVLVYRVVPASHYQLASSGGAEEQPSASPLEPPATSPPTSTGAQKESSPMVRLSGPHQQPPAAAQDNQPRPEQGLDSIGGENLPGRAVGHRPASLQHHHAPAAGREDLQLVADQHYRQPQLPIQFLHGLDDALAPAEVQIGRRLVQQQQLRLLDQGAGDKGLALFPAGDLPVSPSGQAG